MKSPSQLVQFPSSAFISPCFVQKRIRGRTCSSFVTSSSITVSKVSLGDTQRKPLHHVSTPRMESDSGSSNNVIRLVAGLLAGGFLFSSLGPVIGTFTGGQKESETIVDAQLRRVPLFTVTDSTGRPFLSESEDHKLRQGYFFIQPADAENYLRNIQKDTDDAKVLAIGLDEAVKYLDVRNTPAKSIPEKFDIFPDTHELEIASTATAGAFQKQFGNEGVPIFYLDGLAVRDDKNGTSVYPLFFEEEKLEEALSNLKVSNPKSEISLNDMQVTELKQTIRELRVGANPRLKNVVFVPLSDSMNTLKSMQTSRN